MTKGEILAEQAVQRCRGLDVCRDELAKILDYLSDFNVYFCPERPNSATKHSVAPREIEIGIKDVDPGDPRVPLWDLIHELGHTLDHAPPPDYKPIAGNPETINREKSAWKLGWNKAVELALALKKYECAYRRRQRHCMASYGASAAQRLSVFPSTPRE